MYTFPNKLRNFSIVLMVIGFLGLTYGFLTAPSTVDEAMAMVADEHHGEGHTADHGDSHDTTADHHDDTHATHDSAAAGQGADHAEHAGPHLFVKLLCEFFRRPGARIVVRAGFLHGKKSVSSN